MRAYVLKKTELTRQPFKFAAPAGIKRSVPRNDQGHAAFFSA